MTKKEKIKFTYLISYIVILIIGVVLYALYKQTEGANIILLLDIAFGAFGIIGFVILHNLITKYYCHHCNQDFKLSIVETIFAEEKGTEGRKVVCKHCKQKDYYKVVREK